MADTETPQLLQKALSILDEGSAWTKYADMRDADGKPTTSYYQAKYFNMYSAIGMAVVNTYGTFLVDYYIPCASLVAIMRGKLFPDRLADLNDDPKTKFEDVKQVLLEAIAVSGGSVQAMSNEIDVDSPKHDLAALSGTAEKNSSTFVLTHSGKPESVLLGYREYRGLMEAARLLNRPDVVADIDKGHEEKLAGKVKFEGATEKRLKDQRLQEIRARYEALSPCEDWSMYSRDYQFGDQIVRPFARHVGGERIPTPAFAVSGVNTLGDGAEGAMDGAMAGFIYHARKDIPAMLAEIEALKMERDELERRLKKYEKS